MTDSNRTSPSSGFSLPVDNGTPTGSPTPAGGPISPEQHDLFPGLQQPGGPDSPDRALLEAIGRLILVWGQLERTTADKVSTMRESFGDVRAVGGRTRPTIQKLLAELRALVAMRDRHDQQALAIIAEIDGVLQRTSQFRQLVIDGAQEGEADALFCRDIKNSRIGIALADLQREAAQIERVRAQIALL